MKILAVSDVRTQPFHLLARVVEQVRPDLLLYGGDDVGRFGAIPDEIWFRIASRVVRGPSTLVEEARHRESAMPLPNYVGEDDVDRRLLAKGALLTVRDLDCIGGLAFIRQANDDDLLHMDVPKGTLVVLLGQPSWPTTTSVLAVPATGANADRPPGLRRAMLHQVGAAWFWLRVHDRSGPRNVGRWSTLLGSVPQGLAGVIGNDCHPLDRLVFDQPKCHDLGMAPLIIDANTAVIGLPGAPKGDAGVLGIGFVLYTEEEARAHLTRQLAKVGNRQVILVSHAPPRGVLDFATRFGLAHIGSTVVRDFVADHAQVRLVVCGHVHIDGGRNETMSHCEVVNVASHDSEDSPLRFAVIEWNGAVVSVSLDAWHDHHQLRKLDGIGDAYADQLAGHKVDRFAQVACLEPSNLCSLSGLRSESDAARIIAHAKSHVEGREVVYASRRWIPEPLLLVDVETSDRPGGDPWLVGVGLPDGTVLQRRELDPSKHARQLEWLDALITEHPEALVASWGSSDRSAFRRVAKTSGRAVPDWVKERWLDLYHWIRKQVALPYDALTADIVAKHAGFVRASPLDGFRVGMMYRNYRERGTEFDVSAVEAYNLEDVHAIQAVMRWLPSVFGGARQESLLEHVVNRLAEEPMTTTELAEALGLPREGHPLSRCIVDLRQLGFLRRNGARRWELT